MTNILVITAQKYFCFGCIGKVEHWRVVVGREGTVGGNGRISAFDCSGEEGYSVGLHRK
jgi:hypothetical protein